jgi:hypothetical protein
VVQVSGAAEAKDSGDAAGGPLVSHHVLVAVAQEPWPEAEQGAGTGGAGEEGSIWFTQPLPPGPPPGQVATPTSVAPVTLVAV